MATFPRAARAKAGETVVFSWILYRSRKYRDSVMKKVMADPRLAKIMASLEIKRQIRNNNRKVKDLLESMEAELLARKKEVGGRQAIVIK